MAKPKTTLIVSTYNRPGALAKVLDGLARQVVPPAELFLADDGSDALTSGVVERLAPKLPVPLRHLWHEDQGFRKTIILNEAIQEARGDYVVLLDGDCVPHRMFVHDHQQLAEQGWWVQGRRSFLTEQFSPSFQPGRSRFLNCWLRGRASGLFKGIRWPWPLVLHNQSQRGIVGCNLGVWREDLIQVNGFDEEFEGWGLEDSDLGNRLYHLGRYRKFVYGRAIVHHLNHRETSRTELSANHERLQSTLSTGRIRCRCGLNTHQSIS